MILLLCAVWALHAVSDARAHCEIPCGIYDDELRVKMISEHITTIEKSMTEIVSLGKQEPVNYNQIVRWVTNKDEHAHMIQDIVSQYFLTQRITRDADKYSEKISTLQKMLVAAMKCKQTTDPSYVEELHSLLKDFEVLYFPKEKK
jgi:nickel superoxide dismutase